MLFTQKEYCRACGAHLSGPPLVDLGEQEIVDFVDYGQPSRGRAPLVLVQCPDKGCQLVQLWHTVEPDVLFKKFWYRSSINEQMRNALADVVTQALRRVHLQPEDAVLDIGSNDGQLLMNYPKDRFLRLVGFEPAEELAQEAAIRMEVNYRRENFGFVPGYFNAVDALASSGKKKYKVITACAMFYDLDNPNDFLSDVQEVLAEDGIFVIQMNYLHLMLRNLAFDNISHEHLCYYSLTSLLPLLARNGLCVEDVETNDVNGGSIRIYIKHSTSDRVIDWPASVSDLLATEREVTEKSLSYFAERVRATSSTLLTLLVEAKNAGKKVYVYGASTRGMVLLQTVFGKEKASDYIVAAAERDIWKHGKLMAGLDIPITFEEAARADADYMLILPYHFWPSIYKREEQWMKSGGKFILPLPYPRVLEIQKQPNGQFMAVPNDLEEEIEKLRSVAK